MKKKNVTIEDLAIIVGKGFAGVDKKFEDLEKRLNTRIGAIETRLDTLDENIKATRHDVLEIGDRFVPRYEFDNLLIRFNRLEEKIKIKK